MSTCFILRRRYLGVSKIFPDGVDPSSVEHIAVVRAMQDSFDFIQPYPQTRARQRFHRCSEVTKEGLDVSPMYVAARRFTKDSANHVFVFLAHLPSTRQVRKCIRKRERP